MRQQHASVPGRTAAHDASEFHPRRREFPERSLLVSMGVSVFMFAGVAAQGGEAAPGLAPTTTWSHVVVVDSSHAAGPVLQAAFHRVAATGIGGNATAQVLKRLGEYVDSEVAERGKAELSISLMVDATTASKAAKWAPEDMARLVIAFHRKLDPERPQESPELEKIVERIRQGSPADEILGTGDRLKETAASR